MMVPIFVCKKLIILTKIVGCYEIPVYCLKGPSESCCLRESDRVFIDKLKEEMQENPTKLVSPIVGLVSVNHGEKYDSRHPHSYVYETISGNNSRIALQELLSQFPTDSS